MQCKALSSNLSTDKKKKERKKPEAKTRVMQPWPRGVCSPQMLEGSSLEPLEGLWPCTDLDLRPLSAFRNKREKNLCCFKLSNLCAFFFFKQQPQETYTDY
jgi:hypothetical protein